MARRTPEEIIAEQRDKIFRRDLIALLKQAQEQVKAGDYTAAAATVGDALAALADKNAGEG